MNAMMFMFILTHVLFMVGLLICVIGGHRCVRLIVSTISMWILFCLWVMMKNN